MIQLIRRRDDGLHVCQRQNLIPLFDLFSTRTAMKYRQLTHVSLVFLNASAKGCSQPHNIAVMQQYTRIIEDHTSEPVTFAHR